jgi:multidrug efflux pump subunit AcrB
VVGITIPLVLAVTFLAMWYWGIGLHKISLGSLIIALGLLVDDAIIAVEMMVRKMEEGYDKVRAATFAYEITAMPMLTGTLITAAGFLPIGMAKSMTGEYTFAIFAVTVIALVLSWVARCTSCPTWARCSAPPHVRGRPARPTTARAVRHAVLQPLPPRGELVRGAPLADHRRHGAGVRAGHGGHGQGAAAVLPGFQPPEILVDIWFPEGTSFAANEAVTRASSALLQGCERQHLGGLGRAALLPAAGPGVPADQRLAVHLLPRT